MIFRFPKVGELLWVNIDEPIVPKDLHNQVPTLRSYVFRRGGQPSLKRANSSLGFHGDWGLGIGVQWFYRAGHPSPETLSVKPIDLPSLFEGKILHRILAVLGLAGKKVLVIVHDLAVKHSRSCSSKSIPNEPPSHKSLNPNNWRLCVKRCPEHRVA